MNNLHNFWNTQPINIDTNNINKPVIISSINDISKNPITLPDKITWHTFNIKLELDQIQKFLLNFYAESDDNTMRLAYSKDILEWYISNQEIIENLFIGIKYNNKLVGIIFCIPIQISVYNNIIRSGEINFLCIHKILRNKNIAPLLIKELTRRANLIGIYQGFYTGSLNLPNNLCNGKYYHRNINVKRLLDADFIDKPDKMSIDTLKKIYKIRKELSINIRKLEEKDIDECYKKYNNFIKKYNIYRIFSKDEFINTFLRNDKVCESFVVIKNNKITDFISFYYLQSQILNNPKIDKINKAYIYYYFFENENSFIELIDNCLLLLKQRHIDVLNCINQMDNDLLFNKLKFYEGTGNLNFYLFNWQCARIDNNKLGLVIV